MTDNLTPAQRRKAMRSVATTRTGPELRLRQLLREAGYRGYRCNSGRILGRPDIAFLRARVAVFVDGAFWHGHPDKYWPGRTSPYWDEKIERNRQRDLVVSAELRARGWCVVRIWDSDLARDPEGALQRVKEALLGGRDEVSR